MASVISQLSPVLETHLDSFEASDRHHGSSMVEGVPAASRPFGIAQIKILTYRFRESIEDGEGPGIGAGREDKRFLGG